MICKRAEIFGVVQGVWYRGSTEKMAKKLGLTGWVRNRSDGSVEAVFQGPSNAIEQMLTWCRHGPRTATVDRVEVQDQLLDKTLFSEFLVRY
ncbi:MAG: acylphosphatase [Magnetococcales bacterium]|nr:acylphosphatase [Magnetococcales bacterium]